MLRNAQERSNKEKPQMQVVCLSDGDEEEVTCCMIND